MLYFSSYISMLRIRAGIEGLRIKVSFLPVDSRLKAENSLVILVSQHLGSSIECNERAREWPCIIMWSRVSWPM